MALQAQVSGRSLLGGTQPRTPGNHAVSCWTRVHTPPHPAREKGKEMGLRWEVWALGA